MTPFFIIDYSFTQSKKFGGITLPFLALCILFISACMHATWNYLAKHSQGGNLFVFLYMLTSFLWISPIALFIISREGISIHWTALFFVLGSIILHIIYYLSLQY